MKLKILFTILALSAIALTTYFGISNSDIVATGEIDETLINALSQSSCIYNKDLALICAHLSQEIENVYAKNNVNKIKNEYKKLGVKKENIYTLSDNHESYYYSLACMQDININNENYNILFITARGTGGDIDKSWDEKTADAWAESNSDFWEYKNRIYDDSYYFYERIQKGIEEEFLTKHSFLKNGKLKVVITGHSLGGSGASLVAAAFNKCLATKQGWWSNLTTKEDIYCYTFGGIGNVDLDYGPGTNTSATIFGNIDSEKIYDYSIIRGYENIHNLYNYYDSYGPHGNMPLTQKNRNSTYYNKFGHVEMFGKNEYWASQYNDDQLLETTQHSMATYIDALNDPSKSGLKTCNDIKGIKEPETNTQKVEEKPKTSEEEKQQKTENEEKPREKAEDYIIGLWEAGTDSGIEFDEDGVFYFDWSYNYGFTEEGFYSIGEWTSDKSFKIELDGTSLILLMKTINGALDSSYHFEVLIRDDNKAYLVQVSGDKTAETSGCKLPLKRVEE